jgi:uncharacterized protein with PIN domain
MKTMRSTSANMIKVAQRKRVWVLTHRSKGSSRIVSIGLEHLKVKATSPQVKLAESKSTEKSLGQHMNQRCRSCYPLLESRGRDSVKGVRFVTP